MLLVGLPLCSNLAVSLKIDASAVFDKSWHSTSDRTLFSNEVVLLIEDAYPETKTTHFQPLKNSTNQTCITHQTPTSNKEHFMQTLRPSVASQPYASSPGRNSWEEPCVFGGVQPCVSTSGTLCASCTPTWHQGTLK